MFRPCTTGFARRAAAGLCVMASLATATGSNAQVVEDIDAVLASCKEGFASVSCDTDELARALGQITGGQVRPFGSIGMESYAMLTSLRYSAAAIAFANDEEPCAAEEERYAAVEIWSLWVELPEDAPKVIKDKFAVYDSVMDQIIDMELEC